MNPNHQLCPPNIVASFEAYRDRGVPPAGFVRACLENDMCEAFASADENNLEALGHIVAWLYWNMPIDLWKSRERVQAHLAAMAEKREPERDEPMLHDVSKRWDGGLHNRPGTEHNPEGGPL